MNRESYTWDVFAIIRQAGTWISVREIILTYAKEHRLSIWRRPTYAVTHFVVKDLTEMGLIENRYTADDLGPILEVRVTTEGRRKVIPRKKERKRSGVLVPVPVK